MDVMASQFTADVKIKSDTVNVDVTPGDLKFPMQARSPRVEVAHFDHVVHPVLLGKRSDRPE